MTNVPNNASNVETISLPEGFYANLDILILSTNPIELVLHYAQEAEKLTSEDNVELRSLRSILYGVISVQQLNNNDPEMTVYGYRVLGVLDTIERAAPDLANALERVDFYSTYLDRMQVIIGVQRQIVGGY